MKKLALVPIAAVAASMFWVSPAHADTDYQLTDDTTGLTVTVSVPDDPNNIPPDTCSWDCDEVGGDLFAPANTGWCTFNRGDAPGCIFQVMTTDGQWLTGSMWTSVPGDSGWGTFAYWIWPQGF